MSSGPGGSHNDGIPASTEVSKASDKPRSPEKDNANIEISHDDRHQLNEANKVENSKENRLTRKTWGRGALGDCAIGDSKTFGKKDEVVVDLNNDLPEKITCNGQVWQRDSKKMDLWHVEKDGKNFDLNAKAWVKDDGVRVQVAYENGRQVTFKNGEPSEIVHPNGEKWAADPKIPGTWDVLTPNKGNPAQPFHSKIQNVRVNAEDGHIKWHVSEGVGKGHDREITADKKYVDHVASMSSDTAPAPKPQEFVLKSIQPLKPQPLDILVSGDQRTAHNPEPKTFAEITQVSEQRRVKATDSALAMLPKVTSSSFPIPHLPPHPLPERSFALPALPVVRPAVLNSPELPKPSPIKLPDSSSFTPKLHPKEHYQTQSAPAPIEIPRASQGPGPVPVETRYQSSGHDAQAPRPQKAHSEISPIAVTPSIPKDEPAATKKEQSSPQVKESDHKHATTQTKDSDYKHAASNVLKAGVPQMDKEVAAKDQAQNPSGKEQSGHLHYKEGMVLTASAQVQGERPAPYQVPPGSVDYSTYRPQIIGNVQKDAPLQGHAQDSQHQRPIQAHAEQRMEIHHALYGGGVLPNGRHWNMDPRVPGVVPVRPDAPAGTPITLTCTSDGKPMYAKLGQHLGQGQREMYIDGYSVVLRTIQTDH